MYDQVKLKKDYTKYCAGLTTCWLDLASYLEIPNTKKSDPCTSDLALAYIQV